MDLLEFKKRSWPDLRATASYRVCFRVARADDDGNWETLPKGNDAEEDVGDDRESDDSDSASNSELESGVISIVESVVNNTYKSRGINILEIIARDPLSRILRVCC